MSFVDPRWKDGNEAASNNQFRNGLLAILKNAPIRSASLYATRMVRSRRPVFQIAPRWGSPPRKISVEIFRYQVDVLHRGDILHTHNEYE